MELTTKYPPTERLCSCAAAGWLYQEADSLQPSDIEFTVVSDTQPTEQQLADLKFAWTAVKHVKVQTMSIAICWSTYILANQVAGMNAQPDFRGTCSRAPPICYILLGAVNRGCKV